MHCSTCHYWKRSGWDIGYCSRLGSRESAVKISNVDTLVRVVKPELLRIFVETPKDFSCNEWQPVCRKPDEEDW